MQIKDKLNNQQLKLLQELKIVLKDKYNKKELEELDEELCDAMLDNLDENQDYTPKAEKIERILDIVIELENSLIKNKKSIGKVKYIGRSFGIEGLTNNKIYDVLGIEYPFIRVVDDSGESYLYSISKPSSMEDITLCGKWEIIEDTKGKLKKILKE